MMRLRAVTLASTTLILGGLVAATGGCAGSDVEDVGSAGDCNVQLSYDGHRYAVHSGLSDSPAARAIGTADEVGCGSDPTVYGTVSVHTIKGVSPGIAIAVVNTAGGKRSVATYLRDDQPRDRAPQGWPVSLPPEAFE